MTSTVEKSKFVYEFGGPVGTALNLLLLPLLVLYLAHCSHIGYLDIDCWKDILVGHNDTTNFWTTLWSSNVFCPSCASTDNNNNNNYKVLLQCTIAVLGWFLFQVLLERFVPCEIVPGAPIVQHPDQPRLLYRINGHLAMWITLLICFVGWPVWDNPNVAPTKFQPQLISFPHWSWLYHSFAELALVTSGLCFLVNTYLYLQSYTTTVQGQARILAEGGTSGNFFYDFWMGRELNPRIGTFDWKEFCELRPGLIGWLILNASAAHQQYVQLGYLTGSMMLINIFQGLYVWDALYNETAILTTMDITTDGFGFMLLFGDLVWVPFTYSLQARYLVNNDPQLGWSALLAVVAVHCLGFYIFRSANSQKNAFRTDPNQISVTHLQFLQTKRGTKLLTSGWWGMARKINYTGDYIVGLSWCLVCGFGSVVPYFYAVYFAILLIHRAGRDDHMCRQKYGDDWEKYKKIVPYQFIPGVI